MKKKVLAAILIAVGVLTGCGITEPISSPIQSVEAEPIATDIQDGNTYYIQTPVDLDSEMFQCSSYVGKMCLRDRTNSAAAHNNNLLVCHIFRIVIDVIDHSQDRSNLAAFFVNRFV